MSIADEASVEAEKRWPDATDPIFWDRSRDRERFVAGAEWQASRKPEAAPSDTDLPTNEERHALIERAIKAIVRNFTNETQAWNVWNNLMTTPEFVEAVRYVLSVRTSQPVQVEVTADALSAEDRGIIIDALIQHREHALERKAFNSESTPDDRADACARLIQMLGDPALSAALGGGDQ